MRHLVSLSHAFSGGEGECVAPLRKIRRYALSRSRRIREGPTNVPRTWPYQSKQTPALTCPAFWLLYTICRSMCGILIQDFRCCTLRKKHLQVKSKHNRILGMYTSSVVCMIVMCLIIIIHFSFSTFLVSSLSAGKKIDNINNSSAHIYRVTVNGF